MLRSVLFGILSSGLFGAVAGKPSCRTFPGDAEWPTDAQWQAFNKSVDGALVATIPLATVCHNTPDYDAEKCAELQGIWFKPETHLTTSHSTMHPFFANQSCDPFAPKEAQCIVGNYVQYAVRATKASDFVKTIAFAEKHNIRLVIRATGHDYFGKSTGAGALAIWTHAMKDIDIIKNYKSEGYNGPALKAAAGVLVQDANAAAQKERLVIVSGNCPTVGVAGGYTQGGGHGPLSSAYGLSADNVLEWEVVLADGSVVTATPYNKHKDLYFALSGGGGGTYGAVLSVTLRAHKDQKTAGAVLGFTMEGTTPDTFWKGIALFIANLPALVDKKVFAIWLLTPMGFNLGPATAPGLSKEELRELMQPVLKGLDNLGIKYDYQGFDFPTYKDSYDALNAPSAVNNAQLGCRIIPRSLVDADKLPSLVKALREIIEMGAVAFGLSINANNQPAVAPNAVHPAWREAIFLAAYGLMWDNTNMSVNLASQDIITNKISPKLAELTPNGAAYLNEGDFRTPDFQKVFYGDNYKELLQIKKKYDPKDVFYGLTAVGSEKWTIDTPDGRLCRVRRGSQCGANARS